MQYCYTLIGEKNVFVTITEGRNVQKCPSNAHHTFIEKQDFLKIFKCLNKVASKNNIRNVQVLPKNSLCEQKCSKKTCTLNYVLFTRNYIASCKPKTLRQKQLNLCEEITATMDSKNNVESNYIVIVIPVLVVFLVIGLVLTYFYQRNKITNRSSLVS